MVKNKSDIEVNSIVSSRTATSQSVERVIDIAINTVENIVRREAVTITIIVSHNDIILGESQPVQIESDFSEPSLIIPIDYVTKFFINVANRDEIDAAISTPLIIQLNEHLSNDAEQSSAAGDSKKKDRSKSSRKTEIGPQILGFCNVDLMPMVLGEKIVTERLIVERPDNIVKSWMNLPVITVTLTQDETDFFTLDSQVNYLSVTIESIYNLPASFDEDLEYKAATVINVDNEDFETLIFDDGKFAKYRDVEKIKRWRTLNKFEGRVKLSKYIIDCDYGNTKNPIADKINLKKVVDTDNPRIEWNYLSRHVLLNTGQQAMQDRINKYKYWPFQFMATGRLSENGKLKTKDQKTRFYQCYADLSELLYPGRTQARTIAQLYTYDSLEMFEKTGLDKTLFAIEVPSETKQSERKGKHSAKSGSSMKLAAIEPELSSASPLLDEKGNPVFVVIQFELLEPLVQARTTEELTENLQELLGPQDSRPLYPYTGDLPEEQYIKCIRKLVETISESYRDFNEENGIEKESWSKNKFRSGESTSGNRYPYIPDEIDRFTQYLYDTGTYTAVRTTLKKKIARLLDQKFKIETCTWDSKECQNLVANAYLYLVEKMHTALRSDNEDDNEIINSNNLYYNAEEIYELGNISKATKNYTDLIAAKRKDPETWLMYAIFLKKIEHVDRSLECCREAINLNARHKLALLLHGVILAEREDYKAAEIFLKVTTQLYLRFAEAWAILHLFYIRIEYYPGVDLTIRIAEECLMDENRDKVDMNFLEKESLVWSTMNFPNDRVYLMIVVFLLKLNLFDFAGIALARELSIFGRSTYWLYYMAVHHYLLGRFDDALTHLKEAQSQHGADYSISSLMGHCYFKKGDHQNAREFYEFSSSLFNRPDDIHLIGIRLGNYYLDAEEYDKAKKTFLSVCKSSPTANSWLGLGTAFYNMMEFKDAEIALNEANQFDHTNPEVWAYLCLLNMRLHRYDEFSECYKQTVKNDLQKSKLWLLITKTMESLGFVSPMQLSSELNETIINESSEKRNLETEETSKTSLKSDRTV